MFQFNIQIHIEQMGIRLAPAYSKTQKSIEFEKKKPRATHTRILYPGNSFIYWPIPGESIRFLLPILWIQFQFITFYCQSIKTEGNKKNAKIKELLWLCRHKNQTGPITIPANSCNAQRKHNNTNMCCHKHRCKQQKNTFSHHDHLELFSFSTRKPSTKQQRCARREPTQNYIWFKILFFCFGFVAVQSRFVWLHFYSIFFPFFFFHSTSRRIWARSITTTWKKGKSLAICI